MFPELVAALTATPYFKHEAHYADVLERMAHDLWGDDPMQWLEEIHITPIGQIPGEEPQDLFKPIKFTTLRFIRHAIKGNPEWWLDQHGVDSIVHILAMLQLRYGSALNRWFMSNLYSATRDGEPCLVFYLAEEPEHQGDLHSPVGDSLRFTRYLSVMNEWTISLEVEFRHKPQQFSYSATLNAHDHQDGMVVASSSGGKILKRAVRLRDLLITLDELALDYESKFSRENAIEQLRQLHAKERFWQEVFDGQSSR